MGNDYTVTAKTGKLILFPGHLDTESSIILKFERQVASLEISKNEDGDVEVVIGYAEDSANG